MGPSTQAFICYIWGTTNTVSVVNRGLKFSDRGMFWNQRKLDHFTVWLYQKCELAWLSANINYVFAPSLLPKIQLLLTVASLRSESQSRCLIWQTWEKSIDSCLVHVRQLLQESWIPQYWKSESKIFIIQWHNNSRQWPSKIAKTRQSTGKQVELPQVHEQQAVTWIGDNIMCTKSRLDVIT